MADSLEGALARVPGLAGFLGSQRFSQQQDLGNLQQANMLTGILARNQALQREQALRGALAQLPPDASQEDVIKAVRPHANPDDLFRVIQSSADKKFATEQAALSRRDALDARLYDIDRRLEDKALDRTQREALAKAADDTKRELARMGFEVRRDIAAQNADRANKPPAGYRFKPNGSLEAIPGGPADQKLSQAGTGRETVNSLIATLRDQYSQLQQGGGITDPQAGPIDNIKAAIGSSGVGQFVGRAVGTQNQSARNQIMQQRPMLLNAIKQATGMSAKQMDSNAELKLYLSAATDPTLDIRANLEALNKLDELYGLGGKTTPSGGGAGSAGLPDMNAIDAELARRAKAKK